MSHRYGRHGFDAWRHLRKRRINRFTQSLVFQAHITVVHLHFKFANRERIFVVTFDENGMQTDTVRQTDIVDEFPHTRPPQVSKPDPLGQLKYRARMDAATCVEREAASEELSSEEDLRSYARAQGLAYARDHVTAEIAGGRSAAQLRDLYVEAFLEEYRVYLAQETGNGNLPDEYTRRIRKKAREDRVLDTQLGKNLSPRQIDYQAAIRVSELLRLNTRNETDYLTQIEKFANVYSSEYTNDKEGERERPERSDRFPGHS